MSKHTLFYTPKCPDCPPFIEELDKQGIEYEKVDILENPAHLKQFLRLRDNRPEFDEIKKWGFIGIPLFLTKDNKYIFDINDLMGTTCAPTQFEK
ncbi:MULTISPECIES: glutaredoxin domain-containing protein [unclassified Granulicatella]|uniref:glutaredoxin domain-containing protein n=1 Tax=unclassified Granulicatella TaxID=2630493 RepID=UPI00142F7EAA|nr:MULTISPECIES: glutaredoxin domain-containing protein [unclassified Granulicatella]MBF0779731.1 glutaredoxin [Granulicatella sp. 19428wC4_WM01]